MWSSILNAILGAFNILYQVFRSFFVWIFEHTWAFILTILIPVVSLFNAVLAKINDLILGTLENVFADSEYTYSSAWDCIDILLQSPLGNNFLSAVCKDAIYMLNISGFVEKALSVVVPVLFGCIIYKVVKSWIPTVSGG